MWTLKLKGRNEWSIVAFKIISNDIQKLFNSQIFQTYGIGPKWNVAVQALFASHHS